MSELGTIPKVSSLGIGGGSLLRSKKTKTERLEVVTYH